MSGKIPSYPAAVNAGSVLITDHCSLNTDDPLTGTAELTSVILRDPALTANIISIGNSAFYHPAEPVTTVSTASFEPGTAWW